MKTEPGVNISLPAGVRVLAATVGSDRPLEDVIVYTRRRPAMIFLGLYMLLAFGGGGVLVGVAKGSWLLAVPVLGFGIFGGWCLLFELFGRHVLRLGSGMATYRVGLGPWRKELSFRVDSMTKAEGCAFRRTGLVSQGRLVPEVRILQNKCEDVRWGRCLPVGVQDALVALINRRAKGQPLVSGRGPNALTTISHPFAFAVIFLGVLFSAAYSTSGTMRVVLGKDALGIIRSEWWGLRIARKEVPVKDIRYIDFRITGGPKSSSARLDVQDKNKKVLATIKGPTNAMACYQRRLMGLIRCGEKGAFDETRKTKLFFAGLAVFLLVFCAICCMSGEDRIPIPADSDPGDPDYDEARLRRQAIENMRKKLARRKLVKLSEGPSGTEGHPWPSM